MAFERSSFFTNCIVGAALLFIAEYALAAHESDATSNQPSPQSGAVQLRLNAQPTELALMQFSSQAHVQLIFRPDDISSTLQSPDVIGSYRLQDALARILSNTNLRYMFVGERTVAIHSDNEIRERPTIQSPPRISVANPATDSTPAKSELGVVLVTAQKREENLKDVPISISVLSGNRLDKSTFQGVTDVLNTVPGVSTSVNSQSGGTQIVIRGVGPAEATQAGASTVAYYLDSVPFGFVKQAVLPDANVFDLERIEVLRGPQGTLYGANAENGVVRVLTHDADVNSLGLKARALASTTEGGGLNYNGDAAVNVPIVEGKLAVRAVVDYQNLSGWINGPLGTHLNDAELRSYRLKVNAKPTDELSIGLSAWSSHDDYGAPQTSSKDRTITATVPEPAFVDYNTYAAKVGYDLGGITLSSATSYIDYRSSSILDLGTYGPAYAPFYGFRGFSTFNSRVFSEEVLLNSSPNSAWHWTAGLFYRDGYDRRPISIPNLLPAPVDWSYGSKSYAIFGEIGRRFLDDQLDWTLGLRYFRDDLYVRENVQGQGLANVPLIYKSASFNPTTPRAVLNWRPNRELTLYASFSEGFRSGSPQDPGVLEVVPNFPPLRPDRLFNYEIGAKADLLDRRLSIDAAAYYIDWKNVQQPIGVSIGHNIYLNTLLNGGTAKGPGIDFALTARPTESLDLSLTFGWNDLKMSADVISGGSVYFARGERLDYSPEFTAGASAGYLFPISENVKARLSVSGNFTSKQTGHRPDGTFNTGDTIFIARTDLSILFSTHWSAMLFADNLTNNYGGLPTFGYQQDELEPRPRPRTFGVALDYTL